MGITGGEKTVRLSAGEIIEDLQCGGLKIIQRDGMYKFGLDSVLLANFLRAPPGSTLIELCAGSGVVSVLAAAKTKAASVIGIEILDEFVGMAERSVALNGLSGRVKVVRGDIKEIKSIKHSGCAAAVAANPPYIRQNSGLENEDRLLAVAKHEIMCSLRDVVEAAAYLLTPGGGFFMVHRPQRLVDIFSLMREFDVEPKYLMAVHPRREQKPSLVLVEGRKSAGPELTIMKPLYIYDEDGEYISQHRLEQLSER